MPKAIDHEALSKLIEEGRIVPEIATALGIAERSVYRCAEKLGKSEELTQNRVRRFRVKRTQMVLEACLQLGDTFTLNDVMQTVPHISKDDCSEEVSNLIESGAVTWGRECEQCGSSMESFFRSGRFCNQSCSNGFSSSKVSEEGTRRRIEALLTYEFTEEDLRKKSEGNARYWTPEQREKQSKIMSEFMNRPETRKRISETHKRIWANKTPEEREEFAEKVRVAAQKSIENGTHVPWQSRNITSYPERCWKRTLDKAGIEYSHNHPLKKEEGTRGHYFLDFLIVNEAGEQLDFEVDGKQHEYPDRKAHDKVRDEYITSCGIEVLRSKWHNHTKKELIQQELAKVAERLSDFLGREINLQQTW